MRITIEWTRGCGAGPAGVRMACGDSKGIEIVVVGMSGLARMSGGSTRLGSRLEHRTEADRVWQRGRRWF